jgi:two-component system, OmpR family, phosphate regulon sensor histidine kinase PhoR
VIVPSGEMLIGLVPAAVVLVDVHGRVLHANVEARSQYGDALGAVMRAPEAHRATATLPSGGSAHATLALDVPVQRVVQASFRVLPLEDDGVDWGAARMIVVLVDRTEAHAIARMRTDFVAHASHELRTPLASLSGFIETLRGPAADDPEAQRQFLDIMAAQAQRMQRLIDRLLYLSRVQVLEHQRPRDVVDAEDVLDRVLDETAMLLRGRPLLLDLQTPETPLRVHGEEDQIVQVLLNLVENAMKYAGGPTAGRRRDGLVTISVFAREAGRDNDRWPTHSGVLFGVSDDGIGIAPQHLPRLTERFYRVGGKQTGDAPQPGTGLGLSIVKHIVDRHGGRLVIESEPGRGTTCLVWLPAA